MGCYFGPRAVWKDAGDLWASFPPSGAQIRAITISTYKGKIGKTNPPSGVQIRDIVSELCPKNLHLAQTIVKIIKTLKKEPARSVFLS